MPLIQQAVRSGRVDLRKLKGEQNPADLLTKHSLSQARIEMLLKAFGCRFANGRAVLALMLRRGASTKATLANIEQLNSLVSSATSFGGADERRPGATSPTKWVSSSPAGSKPRPTSTAS